MCLIHAIVNNQLVFVRALIAAGANLNTKDINGRTALMYASQKGPAFAQALLDAGADFNAMDDYGSYAFHHASQNGHTKTVQALIAAGANLNTKDMHTTALHYAIKYGNTEIVYLLSRRIMAASRIRRFCTDVCYNPTYNFAQRRILREVGYSCEEIDAFMADKDAKSNYDDTALGRIAARCIEVVTALLAAI